MDQALELVFATYPSWSHLVVRLALAVVFLAHGGQKVFGWFGGPGLAGTIAMFRGTGVPPAAAVTAALIEFLGGWALLLGLLARPAALGIIVIMTVAIAKVHAKHGFFLQGKGGPGFEFNFVLIAMALSIFVGGAGILSLDHRIWLAMGR
jgi:putative oxidoreductase